MKTASQNLIGGALIALLSLLLCSTTYAAEIYKKVAADGSIVYTDEPLPGAEKVDVPPVSVAPAREVQTTRPAQTVDSENDRETLNALQQRYQGFAITSPSPEENLWGTGQSVRVTVRSPQALLPGLRYAYFINDTNVYNGVNTTLTLDDMNRGEHTARVEIQNASGRRIASAGPVTFYIKQNSRLFNN